MKMITLENIIIFIGGIIIGWYLEKYIVIPLKEQRRKNEI